jgi:hypothetical protein
VKPAKDDEALTALAKELAAFYLRTNDIDPARGQYYQTIVAVVEHAVAYAFRIGYRTRVGEETAEEGAPS